MFLKAVVTLIALAVFLLIYIFPLVKVEGDSMFPTFKEGKILWCRRLFKSNKDHCKVGRVYVIHLRDEENGSPYFIIKRLKGVYKCTNGTLYDFRGDNTAVSYDSRQHGLFDSNCVVAKVIGNYPNKHSSYQKGGINEL